MREFGEKYEGNLQSALRGYQKERLAAVGIDASVGEIDRSERKRKWAAIQEVEADMSTSKDSDPERSNKNGLSYFYAVDLFLNDTFALYSSHKFAIAQEGAKFNNC